MSVAIHGALWIPTSRHFAAFKIILYLHVRTFCVARPTDYIYLTAKKDAYFNFGVILYERRLVLIR